MATSTKEFLKAAFTQTADHHVEMAKAFSAMAARHKENGDDALAEECMKASDSHAMAGENAAACAKDCDRAQYAAGAGAGDLDKIAPDNISSVMATDFVKAIPRHGAPQVPNVERVPEQFRHLVQFSDEP